LAERFLLLTSEALLVEAQVHEGFGVRLEDFGGGQSGEGVGIYSFERIGVFEMTSASMLSS
jgi:hypothetical protein